MHLALTDISLAVEDGTALAMIGRKGAGKTALLELIMGLRPLRGGRMTLASRDITGWPPEERAAAGIGWVPQGRPTFGSLSVEENIAAVMRKGEWTLDRIFGVFPRLCERRHNKGVTLSTADRRMLALGRALAVNPLILLIDEIFEGLPPAHAAELSSALRGILQEGVAAVIAEPKAEHALPLSTQAITSRRRCGHLSRHSGIIG